MSGHPSNVNNGTVQCFTSFNSRSSTFIPFRPLSSFASRAGQLLAFLTGFRSSHRRPSHCYLSSSTMVIVSRAFIFILKLTRVVCNLLNAVINRLCPAIPSKLPKNSELLNQSAVQLVNQIKSRKVTVTEVIEAYIARIKDVNPIVNAICDTAFDQVRHADHRRHSP